LRHLGPIFAPTSPKSPPDRARNLKKRPQRPQDYSGDRQRVPGQPLDQNCHSFRIDFGFHFSILSAVSPSILYGLPASS